MRRRIVQIDEARCTGCGLCAEACHEGAIGMRNGKAKLLRDDYCDGLGDCLPACPAGAIEIIEREALPYDEAAVEAKKETAGETLPCGCPGTQVKEISRGGAERSAAREGAVSRLSQWPVQIRLVPVKAPFYHNANLLIAADCSAYAYGDFHERFIKKRVTLVGCPKLDPVDYTEKMTEIIRENEIKSVTVVRMEVPCCGGLEQAVKTALRDSGKFIPWQVVDISADGKILE
jgi:ferredoxin